MMQRLDTMEERRSAEAARLTGDEQRRRDKTPGSWNVHQEAGMCTSAERK